MFYGIWNPVDFSSSMLYNWNMDEKTETIEEEILDGGSSIPLEGEKKPEQDTGELPNAANGWWDVKVTVEMMEADVTTLTPPERKAVEYRKQKLKRINDEMEERNSKLKKLCPLTTSGLCSYMIPSPGWTHVITKHILFLEIMNREAFKKGFICNFDQVKEKFGTYRGYTTIYRIPGRLGRFIQRLLRCDCFNHSLSRKRGCFFDTHRSFTEWLSWKITGFLGLFRKEDETFLWWFEEMVDDLVLKIENECMTVCERCGDQFHNEMEGYEKCNTPGWISYICKECATASGEVYSIEGDKEEKFYRGNDEVQNPYANHPKI